MKTPSSAENQILSVSSFQALLSTPFQGEINAMRFNRQLVGDFAELVQKAEGEENMAVLDEAQLHALQLSKSGQQARDTLISDLKILRAHGASPTLNLIKYYERDDSYPFFPTDVYSYHVDRSPVPTDTFLCTYHGESSDIIPNAHATQKILVPEIRAELRKLYDGAEEGFDAFLSEYFFDLHYRANPDARPISLGQGHVWKLAVDHPQSQVLPCLHRAPEETSGQTRLLMIC